MVLRKPVEAMGPGNARRKGNRRLLKAGLVVGAIGLAAGIGYHKAMKGTQRRDLQKNMQLIELVNEAKPAMLREYIKGFSEADSSAIKALQKEVNQAVARNDTVNALLEKHFFSKEIEIVKKALGENKATVVGILRGLESEHIGKQYAEEVRSKTKRDLIPLIPQLRESINESVRTKNQKNYSFYLNKLVDLLQEIRRRERLALVLELAEKNPAIIEIKSKIRQTPHANARLFVLYETEKQVIAVMH